MEARCNARAHERFQRVALWCSATAPRPRAPFRRLRSRAIRRLVPPSPTPRCKPPVAPTDPKRRFDPSQHT